MSDSKIQTDAADQDSIEKRPVMDGMQDVEPPEGTEQDNSGLYPRSLALLSNALIQLLYSSYTEEKDLDILAHISLGLNNTADWSPLMLQFLSEGENDEGEIILRPAREYAVQDLLDFAYAAISHIDGASMDRNNSVLCFTHPRAYFKLIKAIVEESGVATFDNFDLPDDDEKKSEPAELQALFTERAAKGKALAETDDADEFLDNLPVRIYHSRTELDAMRFRSNMANFNAVPISLARIETAIIEETGEAPGVRSHYDPQFRLN